MPLALEDLEPKPLDALTEAVEPLSGIVGMTETDDASHVMPFDDSVGGGFHDDSVSDGFHVETAEDIVLRSSGASEFQMPNASEEFFGSALESLPPAAAEPPLSTLPSPRSRTLPNQTYRTSLSQRLHRRRSLSRWWRAVRSCEQPRHAAARPPARSDDDGKHGRASPESGAPRRSASRLPRSR